MSRFLVVSTAGAGGDLPPLIGAALELRRRGHEVVFMGDAAVDRALRGVGVMVDVLPAELDLGPRLSRAIRDGMGAMGGDPLAAGRLIEERLTEWARETARPVAAAAQRIRPAVAVTSLFGVEVLEEARLLSPWAVVNSTFYIGPDPPRPVEEDIGPRAVPLVRRYAAVLGGADLVLHATDRVFDLTFDRLPPGHHYVGPLGLWEPGIQPPPYLDEPGDPWVLISVSSQRQDDLPIAEAALEALAGQRVRILLTLGPDHRPDEITRRPPNARIEQVVPHSAVLQRARLLVGHAGHGSVMKALWHGRPMVLMPWGRDQPGVAARAQALGVAEIVPCAGGVDAGVLRASIERVLESEVMAQTVARHGERLRATDPPETAADLLETLTA